jgi:hypothetical protein
VITGLSSRHRPDLALLVGDQVYLDSPIGRMTTDLGQLLGDFQESYVTNWARLAPGRGYAAVLDAAPAACLPDDHEFWNNYPNSSPVTAPATCVKNGRQAWTDAARAMFSAFQSDGARVGVGDAGVPRSSTRVINIPPLSIFLMDNRTAREESRTLTCADLESYRNWVDQIRFPTVPVLVTGPSLLQDAKKKFTVPWKSSWTDANLANFTDDYRAIMGGILELMRRGSPALLLTGDVHYGRVVKAFDLYTENPFYEVISSPSSLVEIPALDQAKSFIDWVRGTEAGTGLRWGSASVLDGSTRIGAAPGVYNYSTLYPREPERRGDHVTVLSFQRTSSGMSLRPTYYFVPKGDPFSSIPAAEARKIDLVWSPRRERFPDAAAAAVAH